jgi:hypothetical protein
MQSHASIQPLETGQLAKEAASQKKKTDYHVVLFFINVALVVIGYGLANPTGFASVLPMMMLRILVLGVSLVYLFNSKKNYIYLFKGSSSWVMWVFFALNIYVLPFSVNLTYSVNKFVNIVPYF